MKEIKEIKEIKETTKGYKQGINDRVNKNNKTLEELLVALKQQNFSKEYIEAYRLGWLVEDEVYEEETTNKTFNFKEEEKMKVVVLKYGKQDECGKILYQDTQVELFKTEEEAQTRVLELGKEFVPEAKDTEELANGLIMLEDEDIPSMYFDIDTIEL